MVYLLKMFMCCMGNVLFKEFVVQGVAIFMDSEEVLNGSYKWSNLRFLGISTYFWI